MKPLIIFDVDGTLLDAVKLDTTCFDAAITEVTGLKLTEKHWEPHTSWMN